MLEEQSKAQGSIKDKDMLEALKIAQELERQEEEEFMRKAIEESTKLGEENTQADEEEAEMIRQAIEMSAKEEEQRKVAEDSGKPEVVQP